MALNINTNIAALKAQQQLTKSSNLLQKSLERLSTGLRINWAADDAAGLAIADALRATAKGLAQAIRNANEGISLIKVADGALIEYGNILATIKEKVTQAANATQNADTRKAIQRDIEKLLAELDNIARTTEFNGQKLLSGSFVNKKFQIGSASYVTATLSIRSAEIGAVGGTKTAVIDLNTIGPVQLTITNAASGLSVTTEKIELLYNNDPDNGAGALANEINRYSGITGVSAVAVVEVTSEPISDGTITGLKINGVTIGDITVRAADADGALVSAINAKSLETGVTATVTEDGRLVLTSNDGRAIKVEASGGLLTVLGKNADDLSTLGYVRIIQKGVADFQIEGVGGTGVGADITLKSSDQATLDGVSTLVAGSTIAANSKIEGGSVVGGDATLRSTMEVSDNAAVVKADSVIAWGSTLAEGTIITGDIVVSGDTGTSTLDKVALTSDMLAAAGTILKEGTVIGKGTVVYGSLAEALGVAEGSVIDGATLNTDVTLDTDIVLKYDPTTNTQIAAGSTIAAGSKLGADFEIGLTWDGGSTTSYSATANITMGASYVLTADSTITYAETVTTANGSATLDFTAGDFIKAGTSISVASDGSATVTVSGNQFIYYQLGDGTTGYLGGSTTTLTIDAGESFTILNDVHLVTGSSLQFKYTGSAASTTGTFTVNLKEGSKLDLGWSIDTTNGAGTGTLTFSTSSSTSSATFSAETEIAIDSYIVNTSELKAGSKFGGEAYVAQVTTTEDSTLTRGSVLEGGSVIKKGSVLNTDDFILNADVTLSEDTTFVAGTLLKDETLFKAGTVLTQDMQFYTGPGNTGTHLSLTAGTVLDQDLYLDGDTTLTEDLILKAGSVVKADSEIVVVPTGEMEDVETKFLGDLNVLTYEGAQIALTVVEAAISYIDGIRAELGSVQVMLESTVANISVTYTNTKAAEAAIREVDFAEEVANFTKMQVLMQAGSFALAQANTIPQIAIQLLQG